MKKLFLTALLSISITAFASELITIVSPYSPGHSGTTALRAVIDESNKSQSKYNFIIEFKPGGQQVLAVQHMDQQPQTRVAVIAPTYVQNTRDGVLDIHKYRPLYALGDACWALISNQDISQLKHITVGGVGIGSATHLTSLQLADKYKFKVTFVPVKSNFDAAVLMAGNNGIDLVVDRLQVYEQFKEKNTNLKVIGMSCPVRHPQAPTVKTLKEQGINSPYIWNILIANKEMSADKQRELAKIFNTATLTIGSSKIIEMSDMVPPIFSNVTAEAFYNSRIETMSNLLNKHYKAIEESKNGK